MNKKLAYLEQMIASEQADSFARYAYALELKKEDRLDDAVAAFVELRKVDSDYLAQYLMAGQMLIDADRKKEARPWLEAGLQVAQAQSNGQAVGELEAALEDC